MQETPEEILKLLEPLCIREGFSLKESTYDPEFFGNTSLTLANTELLVHLVRDRGIWVIAVGPTHDTNAVFDLYLVQAVRTGTFEWHGEFGNVISKLYFLEEHYEWIREQLDPSALPSFREKIARAREAWAARYSSDDGNPSS